MRSHLVALFAIFSFFASPNTSFVSVRMPEESNRSPRLVGLAIAGASRHKTVSMNVDRNSASHINVAF